MKKIIFLLLITAASYGQTLQNPTYGNVKLKQNTTSATATKVNVQEADGIVNTKPLSEFGTVKSVTGTDGISVADGTLNPVIGITSISQLKVAGLVTDLGNKVDKITGSSLLSDAEITRLSFLANYTHPANHPPSIITQDASNRFVTDVEKATWNAKQAALGYTPYNATNPNGYETPTQLNARDTNNRARANHTGTQLSSTISDLQTTISNNTSVAANTIKRSYPSADETKLSGIASGATVNSTDAQLRDRTTHTGAQAISTVTGLQTALDGKQASLGYTAENVANKNIASGYAGLGTDGKLLSVLLPDITISDTFVTASQAAMLALTAQTGDVSVRTDLNKSFILKINDPTVLANWQELLTPTSAVTTVFGRNGGITAQSGDYNADQITETASRVFQTPTQRTNNDATSSIQTQLNGKQASGSYEIAFAKNTAFNKNFGTTTGTVGDGAVVAANTAKISFDSTSSTRLANTSGTNTGDNATNTQYSGLVSNATHTGDVTGSTSLTIANGVVSNAKLANMLTKTYKGRTSAATGVPEDVSVTTLKADLSLNNVPNTDFTSAVAANTAKVGITTTQANNITANNAKISFDATSSARLANTSGTNTGDQVLTGLNYAPTSGSANYIQNGTTQQTANLNISGSGTFGSSVTSALKINGTPIANNVFNGAIIGDADSERIKIGYNNLGITSGLVPPQIIAGVSNLNLSSRDISNGSIVFHTGTGVTEKLRIDGAGAATFSSSVSASSFLGNGSGLTGLTKSQVGLNLVDNTADSSKSVDNSSRWNGAVGNLGTESTSNVASLAVYDASTTGWRFQTVNNFKSTLGLGSNAYSSTAFAPASGSANYIQNGTTQQTANLNISGSGVFGSSVTANGLISNQDIISGYDDSKVRLVGLLGTTNFLQSYLNSNKAPRSLKISGYNDDYLPNITLASDTFNATGAATFSSSVTASKLLVNSPFLRTATTENIISRKLSNDTDFKFGLQESFIGGAGTANRKYILQAGVETVSTGVFANVGEALALNPNGGNVGIGTTTPTRQLSIQSQYPAIVLKSTAISGGVGGSTLYFGNATTDGESWISYNNGLKELSIRNNSIDALKLNSTGAATFSSSVTAPLLKTLSATGEFLRSESSALGASQVLSIYGQDGIRRAIIGYGSTGNDTFVLSNDKNAPLVLKTNALDRLTIAADGAATFSGTVTASGGFFNSDRRLKDIFKRDGDVAYYTWKDKRDDKKHIGYVAQEVQKQYPDQVQEGADGMLSVNYVEVLVAKIQDLEKRIQELEKAK